MFSFDGLPPESCPECKRAKDAQFQEVRTMVKENPGITALELHERTAVPLPSIIRYIESGVLEIVSTKENLDNIDLQIWIDKSTAKGKKAKQKPEETAEKKPEVDVPDYNYHDVRKSKKAQMNFIVK
jgi:glutaredoxin